MNNKKAYAFVIAWFAILFFLNQKLSRVLPANPLSNAPLTVNSIYLSKDPHGAPLSVVDPRILTKGIWVNTDVSSNVNCTITISYVLRRTEFVNGRDHQVMWGLPGSSSVVVPTLIGTSNRTVSYFINTSDVFKSPPAPGDYTFQRVAKYSDCLTGPLKASSTFIAFKVGS